MRQLLPIITCVFAYLNLSAQDNTIPIQGKYTISEVGEEIVIELKSVELDSPYSRNERFEIFGPDLGPVDGPNGALQVICAFDDCDLEEDMILDETGISYPSGNLNAPGGNILPQSPLVLSANRNLDPGQYTVLVTDGNSRKVKHRRTFLLTHPAPVISGFKVIKGQDTTSNLLRIDQNRDLFGVMIQLEGENLDEEFESVNFGGLPLEPVEGKPGCYTTTRDWTSANLKKIDLENAKLSIKRKFVDGNDEVTVDIIGQSPIINGNLIHKINAGQGRFMLNLNVSNLYPRAQLKIGEVGDGNVLEVKGVFDDAQIDPVAGTLSHLIPLREEALTSGNARFTVQVINRDGTTSKVRTVQLQVIEATITAEPLDAGRPFIKEVPVLVRFKRAGIARPFRFEGPVVLRLNGMSEQPLLPQNIDGALNQFTAEVKFPKAIASSVPFEIKNGSNTWRGFLSDIKEKPDLVSGSRNVFIGGKATLQLTQPNSEVKAIIRPPVRGVKLVDNDFTDAQIEIEVDKNVAANTKFSVILFLQKHELESVEYAVEEWPDPTETVKFSVGSAELPVSLERKIIFNVREPVTLFAISTDPEANQMTAQLIKANGTKLGTALSLIFDAGQNISSTTLNPYAYGLRGGDEFMVELVNPQRQPVLQRGYIKREGLQRILVNAGVSAINVFFKEREDENGDKLPNTTLISGVNLGVYYMSEQFHTAGKRPLGYGLNLIAQEEDKKVMVRVATSVLIYETLTTGLSFGKDGPAFFVGANVSFLDLSKIFSGN